MNTNKQNPQTDTEILLPGEAAFFLRVSQKTLLDRANKGLIPGSYKFGEWRFIKSQLIQFMINDAEEERIKRTEDHKLMSVALAGIPSEEKKRGRRRNIDTEKLLNS
jgi:hypothetical protein